VDGIPPFALRLTHLKGAPANEKQKLSFTTDALERDDENVVGRLILPQPFKALAPLYDGQDASVNEALDTGDDVTSV
jgi:hypothetical protein